MATKNSQPSMITAFLILIALASQIPCTIAHQECCSWNFRDCDETTSDYCKENREHCEDDCGAVWITPMNTDFCAARWELCPNTAVHVTGECCEGTWCEQTSEYWRSCQPIKDECCSWNNRDCTDNWYCKQDKFKCESDCSGDWIKPPKDCLARYDHCPITDIGMQSNCCPGTVCTDFGNWQACEPGTPIGGTDPSPTPSPTCESTPNPTSAPTRQPIGSPTSAPTGNPTANPTGSPTSMPTASPTASPTAFPTATPTVVPTASPTTTPTAFPTAFPTAIPTIVPTASPTTAPTSKPTGSPTIRLIPSPTARPTDTPTIAPTAAPTTSPVSPSATTEQKCCSWNFRDCEDSTTDYCKENGDHCENECGGVWLTPVETSSCAAYWELCPNTAVHETGECCEGTWCEQTNEHWRSCQPIKDECCSWNNRDCTDNWYCKQDKFKCESDCSGNWIKPPKDCLARYDHCPFTDIGMQSNCCPGTVCTDFGNWQACEPGTPVGGTDPPRTAMPTSRPTAGPTIGPTTNPTRSPTVAPTKSPSTKAPTSPPTWSPTLSPTSPPTSSPTEIPVDGPTNAPTLVPTNSPTTRPVIPPTSSPTMEPSGSPTKQPVASPTSSPTLGPTTSPTTTPTSEPTPSPTDQATANPTADDIGDITFPTGDFITAGTANERITFPEPPEPSFPPRANCPHEESGLREWQTFLPSTGNVQIPDDTRVVIRRSISETLGKVTIPASSELIIGEDADGITMDTAGFDVQGKLTIGSPDCRIETPVTITLHGSRPSDVVTNVPDPTVKGISVSGELNIHGKRYYRTWTRLALTVEAGDDILMVQNKVNWEEGQEIVLITTAMKDSREWHRNEVAIVKRVIHDPINGAGVGSAVLLESPVQYDHNANKGYQGEVGLLSRTVMIQGDESSEPTDPDPLNCRDDGRFNLGDRNVPCPNTQLTGYGGHVIIRDGGRGYVEGLELYRMGQTNVLGRYPMHFHLLRDSCEDCYFRDSSIHQSYYRCISIHGTNSLQVSENVAYDVTGFCYYMEDGVETENRLEYNLGAHIHLLGDSPPWGWGQEVAPVRQSNTLTLPADIAASAFYITNVHNHVIGNVASGGWAGFAFPNLRAPVGLHKNVAISPEQANGLTIDGNTAHSTSWWWFHAAAFYFGGSLYYVNDNGNEILEYNAGRDFGSDRASDYPLQVTNSKVYLAAAVGLGSWTGRFDVVGFECHDCGLSLESLSNGFWINDLLVVCRTNVPIMLPEEADVRQIHADGFIWYDTDMEHIITKATFRNCGYRSDQFNQYDSNADRGCGDENDIGCYDGSSVWGMLTHSDQFVPELMQATKDIEFDNCGRRFRMNDFRWQPPYSSVSARVQNWLDMDGTITGLGERSAAGSGLSDAGMWWQADEDSVYDPQAPLWFFSLETGPQRGLGHFNMKWDDSLHNRIGGGECSNGDVNVPCQPHGYLRHLGERYENDPGLPVTANGDIVGPVGGFGWRLELDGGAPRSLKFDLIEVDSDTPLLLSIAYPQGTTFTIVAHAAWCYATPSFACTATFQQVGSVSEVLQSNGDTYHVDNDGVLTFRVVQTPKTWVGTPDFYIPDYDSPGRKEGELALQRFERDSVRLPRKSYGPWLQLDASCSNNGVYCTGSVVDYRPNVCPGGYVQTGYDTCTNSQNPTQKYFADGTFSGVP